MRIHLLWLLPLILLGSSAQALRCHQCSGVGNCYNPTSCKNTSRYCLTSWYTTSGHQMDVTKTCAYTCPDIHQSQIKASCCNTDLCNSTGRLHASWGLLALSIWFIYLSK
ncbi:muscarinic toxin-like protein 3 [Meriones unguiculatus]|uniref:muscarinic toxin-like protein 3 n=1 Tax=Meriones unguiculatus TaxID=10047 RepID=UPI000B4F2EFA|nr:muscarinic toxin-like protein 3 [Meriones unguiculatus]